MSVPWNALQHSIAMARGSPPIEMPPFAPGDLNRGGDCSRSQLWRVRCCYSSRREQGQTVTGRSRSNFGGPAEICEAVDG
jgi:hypothetical protein